MAQVQQDNIFQLFALINNGCSITVFQDWLNTGIDVNRIYDESLSRGYGFNTLLHFAVSTSQKGDNLKIVKLLLDTGAEVNLRDDEDWTPLMAAVAGFQPRITECVLRMLIDAGADVNLVERDDYYSALMTSSISIYGKKGIFRTLIDADADLNLRNIVGDKALTYVGRVQYKIMDVSATEIITMLIEAIY